MNAPIKTRKMSAKQQLAFDRARVNASYSRVGHGIQVPMLKLTAIMDAGLVAIQAGSNDTELDVAVFAAISAVAVGRSA